MRLLRLFPLKKKNGEPVVNAVFGRKPGKLKIEPLYRAELFFHWYDLRVGLYVDRKKHFVYFCPLPTLVFRIRYERGMSK
jgi:hypothetical protein